MHRTLYQAGMYKTALKKKIAFCRPPELGNKSGGVKLSGAVRVKAPPVWASPSEIMGALFGAALRCAGPVRDGLQAADHSGHYPRQNARQTHVNAYHCPLSISS